MRAYLLGELSDREASEVEITYFTEPEYLRRIRAAEDLLIRDYLRGRLDRARKARFETRYLTVPALRLRVDALRSALNVNALRSAPASGWAVRWLPAIAVPAVVVLAAGTFVALRVRKPAASGSQVARVATPVADLNVRLSPGVAMGGHAMTEIDAPRAGRRVLFQLELPGGAVSSGNSLDLLRLDADGRSEQVWSDRGSSGPAGPELTARPDASVLTPADYLFQLRSPERGVRETWMFRVRSPRP